MFQRKLGRSGIEVSAMGMGCWAIGGPWWWSDGRTMGWSRVDDAESIRAIHAALDRGIDFFDTAANYGAGHSERILGQALSGRRDRVVIATKFGHIVNEETKVVADSGGALVGNIQQDCETSLRRLGTDYIDIYQLHAGSYPAEEAVAVRDALEELVAQGKIRAYGWSTDHVDRARVFAEGEQCTSIQFSLSVFHDNAGMRALCDEFDMGSINKKPLSSGILTGKFTPESSFPEDDFRRALDFTEERYARLLRQVDELRDVLTSEGRTLAQGAIAWIWARSERAIPIPGFKSVAQVEENAGAMQFGPLSQDQMQEVERIVGRDAA
jgi:aryl-alcohol dehydrogenase-like predicted oxidoreductase